MSNINIRLSVMMFLQFFVWGAWYVTVGNYMTEIGLSGVIYWAYTVSPIAGIVSPFFLGMVADRFFATEKVLGWLHLLGALAMFAVPFTVHSSVLFIATLLLHVLFYMPTLGLTNSLAFHHITDQKRQFPIIRVFGTVGWIAANILVSLVLHADRTAIPLYTAGAAGIVLALYSFTLPHTPPSRNRDKPSISSILGVDALRQLWSRPFAVFAASSLLISIPLSAYYAYAPVFVDAAGIENPAFKMSFGQMSEVVFMIAMPFCFRKLGVKWMLIAGMGAWVLRYAAFAWGAPAGALGPIMVGILLHGICYDFFFVTGQIYVDQSASPEIRGQAQGFLVLLTYGIGMLVGAQISGWIWGAFVPDPSVLTAWREFWLVPAGFAALILAGFAAAFPAPEPTA